MQDLHPRGIAPSETDGEIFQTIGGEACWGPPPTPPVSSVLVPLTTTTAGLPELVWDANNELVLTEVSL